MTFKVGDKAIHATFGEVEVTYVPDKGTWTAYRRSNGYEYAARKDLLAPIPAADPRIDVVAKAISAHVVGSDGPTPLDVESFLGEAHAVLAALDAMPVAPAARYRDCDGDVWAIQDDGLYALVEWAGGVPVVTRGGETYELGCLTRAHGPLTALDAPLKVGDSIRILKDGLDFADVRVGDVLQVEEINAEDIWTNAPRAVRGGAQRWSFERSAEGTGWGRV